MKASILIIGHPHPEQVEFGADHVANLEDAIKEMTASKYPVLVALSSPDQDPLPFLKKIKEINPDTQSLLVSANLPPQELQKLLNTVGLFKILPSFDDELLKISVREALEEYELIKQNQTFLALTTEQNQRLQYLTGLLEQKVKARERFLLEARETLVIVTQKTETLNRALVAIQRSVTRQEVERHLSDALKQSLDLAWIRVIPKEQSFLEQIDERGQASQSNIFSCPLIREKELLGHIYFGRAHERPFTSDEDDFMLQIADAVALAMDRIIALEALDAAKQEWDSTFDAITEPVSLVTDHFSIIRANKSFAERCHIEIEKLSGRKCHDVLFSRSAPCEGCSLGTSFEMPEGQTNNQVPACFSVTSQKVQLTDGQWAYAQLYHDTLEEKRIQRQILESSKMAEIGTIGSSIAHEINNPLGGMIAFLQILKSELKKEDKIYDDVVEMEQAALRCKKIVENLLAFTRQSVSSEMQNTRVSDLIKLVVNIMELQTRGLGIPIEVTMEDRDGKIRADTNQLVQVLVNIMQNSCESLAERLSLGKRTPLPKIEVKTTSEGDKKEWLRIEITDNGTGIAADNLPRVLNPFFTTKDKTKNPGLGLSVSYQIVKEHGGQMEISSVEGKSTTVILRIPAKL